MKTPARYGRPDPEVLDTTPVAMPLGSTRPTPIADLIARMVRTAMEQERGEEFETFEESEDFEEEDPDNLDFSPYQLSDMHMEALHGDTGAVIDLRETPPALPETADPTDPNSVEAS